MANSIASLQDESTVLGRYGKFLRVAGEAGIPPSFVQRVIDDTEYRARFAHAHECDFSMEPLVYGETPAKRALEIVRTAYGPDLVTQLLGYQFGSGDRKMLENVPCPTDLLERHADTHILVPRHAAATILSLKGVKVVRQKSLFRDQDWYHREDLASRPCGSGWMFLRKNAVPGTFNLPRSEQVTHLLLGERVPYGIEITYATILHKIVTDEWLFSKWLRCQDIDSNGYRLRIGVYEGRLHVYNNWDDDLNPNIGLPGKC